MMKIKLSSQTGFGNTSSCLKSIRKGSEESEIWLGLLLLTEQELSMRQKHGIYLPAQRLLMINNGAHGKCVYVQNIVC